MTIQNYGSVSDDNIDSMSSNDNGHEQGGATAISSTINLLNTIVGMYS